MAKFVNDLVMNAALDAAHGTSLIVCAGQPADRAGALAAALATVAITGVDYTRANGDTSGRKDTIAQQVDIAIASSGIADHVAIIDGTNLLVVTTVASQALTSGGTVTVNAFDHEILDAA